MLKIATWNVNSLRVRLPHVLTWIQEHLPDVLALQETKLIDTQFPVEAFQALGYEVCFRGQPTYNGVAILSRHPMTQIRYDEDFGLPSHCRCLAAAIQNIQVLNLYVPNGSEVGSEKYLYKLEWLRTLRDYLIAHLPSAPPTILLGDFNIAPEDRDVHDPVLWHEQVLVSTAERQALQAIMALGFFDSIRQFNTAERVYSWWDYRAAAFRRNHGLRIDLILPQLSLKPRCVASAIDKTPRSWERPSDHVPVWITFGD